MKITVKITLKNGWKEINHYDDLNLPEVMEVTKDITKWYEPADDDHRITKVEIIIPLH